MSSPPNDPPDRPGEHPRPRLVRSEAWHTSRISRISAKLESTRIDLHAAVDEARRDGHTWAAIGAALGITKQAAHERFTNDR